MYAQENWSGSTGSGWINNFRPDGGDNNTYIFDIDDTLEPRVRPCARRRSGSLPRPRPCPNWLALSRVAGHGRDTAGMHVLTKNVVYGATGLARGSTRC